MTFLEMGRRNGKTFDIERALKYRKFNINLVTDQYIILARGSGKMQALAVLRYLLEKESEPALLSHERP